MKISNQEKRIKRVRAKILGTAEKPRLAVFRSTKQVYAQLIDDEKSITLVAASSLGMKDMKPIEKANKVGEMLAEKALAQKIKQAVFDRRDKKYHGQVKALAEAARAKGLKL